ncbi:phosphopantetheine-binding protein [Reichenbachiella agarivorans]|uniref:Phosphopantetheine-binding protein n=1 Tax=Reichenbachiella agarivorans TaxID=2979464 RepID=A0ABY6CK50_9BACT|nr:phosphopantetheine-binding protein [Reichenbachiella agarivorans]UXP30769.1 phosphopantetheine-binding protein [Reichenbachiella agarivorans]
MDLKQELKESLIAQLNLEEVTPEDIKDDAPLFGEGLGLDSIDALEIIVLLDNNYKLKIGNPEEAKDIFYSINTLAKYIEENRA